MVAQHLKALNATELHPSKWLIVCYVNLISIKIEENDLLISSQWSRKLLALHPFIECS